MIKTIFKLLIAFLMASSLIAQTNNLFSPQNRLKFADQLYKEKDFLRALGEYKEYLKSIDNDTVRFKFSNSFFRIGRYEEAAQNFKTLFTSSTLSEESKFLFYQSNFFQNNFERFRDLYEQKLLIPTAFKQHIDQLNSITYFLERRNLPPVNNLINPFPDSVQSKLYSFYQMIKNPHKKDPLLAGALSAIIPGAGKVYTQNYSDAAITFAATLLSGYLAISSFENDQAFKGWLFTAATAFFYGGGIYGSAVSAQQFNAKIQFNLDSDIKFFFQSRNYFLPNIDF